MEPAETGRAGLMSSFRGLFRAWHCGPAHCSGLCDKGSYTGLCFIVRRASAAMQNLEWLTWMIVTVLMVILATALMLFFMR